MTPHERTRNLSFGWGREERYAQIFWLELFGIGVGLGRCVLLCAAHDNDVVGIGRQLVGDFWSHSCGKLLRLGGFDGFRCPIMVGLLSKRGPGEDEVVDCRKHCHNRCRMGDLALRDPN